MIRSLPAAAEDIAREADILVIGGGIAGLLVATRAAECGRRVIVMESGGEHQFGETHALNEVVQLRSVYQGAASGRFRCLGGTSTRWGGAMLPFLAADFVDGWPVEHGELMHYASEVEALFGLPPGPYEAHEIAGYIGDGFPTYVPRLAKWPSFAKRNVAALLDRPLRAIDGPEVWLEANAAKFELAPRGRLRTIVAEAPNGRRLTVCAGEVVLAAGAIESTRLLLLLDHQHDNRLFTPYDVLGRYFHDHLSVVVGNIDPFDRTELNRVVGFRFEGKGMRNLRFEPGEDPLVRAQVPAGFAHIAFTSEEGSGFDALRLAYRQLQQRRLPGPATLLPLLHSMPWLARAMWWRYREHRLLYPPDAAIQLHMVIEQTPRHDNRLLLTDDRNDAYGQPLAAIDWSVSRDDEAALTRATDLFLSFWQNSALARLGTVRRRPAKEAERELALGTGIYHPGGTTRMGRSAVDGVVDGDLRVFGVPNLSVASTSVFPTAGGANPTMTLMMMALRLANRLVRSSA